MNNSDGVTVIESLRTGLADLDNPNQVLKTVARYVVEVFQADRVFISYSAGSKEYSACYTRSNQNVKACNGSENNQVQTPGFRLTDKDIKLPLFVSDVSKSREEQELLEILSETNTKSCAVVPLYTGTTVCGALECHFSNRSYRWRKEDILLLQQIADHCSHVLEKILFVSSSADAVAPAGQISQLHTERLSEFANLLIVKTDDKLTITDVIGNVEAVLGIKRDELISTQNAWTLFMNQRDYLELAGKIRKMGKEPKEISEEIRVKNRQTGEQRDFLLKAVPVFDENNVFCGWEGFGLDISDKRKTEKILKQQSKRIEALYEVARSLQVNMDPALVTLKGLRALITATGSDAGFGCFYDRKTGLLELVAAEGLSREYIAGLGRLLEGKSLVRHAVERHEGFLIDDIQKDQRADTELARLERLHSTIVMPLMFEQEVLGAIVLFCRRIARYTRDDYDLVAAASHQIGLAARQAEFYAAEKRQASSLATLYRLSHELSTLFTPKEIAEHAFPIIQEELACKRMWLGVVNESGSHIVGQGGVGPGIRKRIIDLQIELDLRHDYLDRALQTKRPVIMKAGSKADCSGLNRLVKRLNLGTIIILPLVTLGQVVGVLIVEPAVPSTFFVERKLPILRNMASEIATVIFARRFESKMADADKMRMAGLLASGVAHNFNNLLQAVMGQASLIEMQLSEDSPLRVAARTIIDAAGRGAALIKQLMNFSMAGPYTRRVLSVNELVKESEDLYRSVLGSRIKLKVKLSEKVPEVYADYSQIQQMLTNLVVNAKEALEGRANAQVEISTQLVRLKSGEVDPELSPGNYLRLDVKDNGIGMDREQQMRCFEPFYTSKEADASTGIGFNGSGLGLSSAYSIARQHNGIITVRSAPSRGTVFSVYLPARQPGRMAAVDASKAVALRTGKEAEAVVYDLGERSTFSVRSTLESLGIAVHAVSGIDEIVNRVRERRGYVRMVIVDIDRIGNEVNRLIDQLQMADDSIRIVGATIERPRWAKILSIRPTVTVVDKPIGVWAIHSVIKEITGVSRSPLNRNITLSVINENGKKQEATPEQIVTRETKRDNQG
ncbi:MAG: GAF domain-containing protein [Candidatus Dadabacteria bacterium]|nr:MAG: GAF domain-containing protein [Candidatus Dadabacteria bacterium]